MLSICIPTYKRPEYLYWTLNKLHTVFPNAQVVISDNDPESDSGGAWCFDKKHIVWFDWFRQSSNIGAFANMHAALSYAKGDYAVYCADDDYLLPDQVAIAIEYLDAHPDVAAYCAPCEIWNEVEGTPFWNAFGVPRGAQTFAPTQGMELFNFLIENHVWPEHPSSTACQCP